MKKIISILLGVVLIFSTFAFVGCSEVRDDVYLEVTVRRVKTGEYDKEQTFVLFSECNHEINTVKRYEVCDKVEVTFKARLGPSDDGPIVEKVDYDEEKIDPTQPGTYILRRFCRIPNSYGAYKYRYFHIQIEFYK